MINFLSKGKKKKQFQKKKVSNKQKNLKLQTKKLMKQKHI